LFDDADDDDDDDDDNDDDFFENAEIKSMTSLEVIRHFLSFFFSNKRRGIFLFLSFYVSFFFSFRNEIIIPLKLVFLPIHFWSIHLPVLYSPLGFVRVFVFIAVVSCTFRRVIYIL